jgi:predicted porin
MPSENTIFSLYSPREQRSRLGFIGSEDLGGGLKATFQLEQRFSLANGKSSPLGDFEGAANVGLAGNFGQVRFGRVNELSTETYRVIDPFEQYGVASMYTSWWRGDYFEGRLGYTARYDSPSFSGFKFGASYTVKNNPDASQFWKAGSNNGVALSGTYTNGPLYLVANYNKRSWTMGGYNWNVGGAYSFGPVKLSLGYEKTTDWDSLPNSYQKNLIVGLTYSVGSGLVKASYNRGDGAVYGFDGDKWAIGYTHNLSKRTSAYINYAHDKVDYALVFSNTSKSGVEVGLTHKF